jgi:hypothetical protein
MGSKVSPPSNQGDLTGKLRPANRFNGGTEGKVTSERDDPQGLSRSDGPERPPLQIVHQAGPRFIANAPTLLAEQSLALIAVLCAPRERCRSLGAPSMIAAHKNRSEGLGTDLPVEQHENLASKPQHHETLHLPNPYRAALLGLHDLPHRNTGDDSAYSFSRLYEMLGVWIVDPRGALVAYHLIAGNRRFRTFVLARTDPDVILLPLLASMHLRASGSALRPLMPTSHP